MKWKNVIGLVIAVVLSGVGMGLDQSLAGPVIVPGDPGPGGGGGGGNSLPTGWSMSSSASLNSANASINGDTMGIPYSVYSYTNWNYQEDGGLFFTTNFSTGGNIKKPTESVNLNTGGNLTVNDIIVEKVDDGQGGQWWLIHFNEMLSINWNGGYSSSVWINDHDGQKYANGYFNGSASVSPSGNLSAMPELDFNHWDGNPPDFGFNEYDANIRINGFIPSEMYTMTVVPEPATLALLVTGGIATYFRRRRIA
ncbi:MAG: PEP-CTERM sorting domain-containing protein [Candidatus Vogelbacteria bacterium]